MPSAKQGAAGSQESGGTLNFCYSAVELKATVSSESRINVMLWYPLVGLMLVLNSSGHKWYVDDGPHLGHLI